ncbi:MAG: Crp/Fnr family transcriptional regulator [Flavobacteriales bacterium]|nr:Crp/Fnr family transcriptional regulator [Flavobacteriales bacterium]
MDEVLKKTIPFIESDLLNEIKEVATIQTFDADTPILNDGSYIKVIPIVVSGQVKVYREIEDRELLLYYIEPAQSCFMSVSACVMNEKSKVRAITETETELILIPTQYVITWLNKYPRWVNFVIQLSNVRFEELLKTIDDVTFGKLDVRLVNYLVEKSKKSNSDIIKITHQLIADELGSAREVISRLLKQLENDGKVVLSRGAIDVSELI